jgi:CRISP-associated protein Cas1
MSHRVVTVSTRSFLSLDLGRLSIRQGDDVVAAVPIEDLAAVVLESSDVTLTQAVLAQLCQSNVAVVLCDGSHLPCALLQPLSGHTYHSRTLRLQIECSEPKRKRLWQQIVQAKIQGQAAILASERGDRKTAKDLTSLAQQVRSGDSDNLEGFAARIYFEALFGKGFERERGGVGANAMLNYGYAIVRAMVARALVGAGLHPALGIQHRGPANPFNLADDAIEPLRPVVDRTVLRLIAQDGVPEELGPELKRNLLELTVCAVRIAGISYPITTALERYAANMREAICGTARRIQAPGP